MKFARARNLPIVQVIRRPALARPRRAEVDVEKYAFTDEGVARYDRILADVPDGTPSAEARALLTAWLAKLARGAGR